MVRILVIDDNPANLDLMLYLLRAFGHEVEAAADGLAGYEALQRDGYDLVLTDILMPGIDGYEFVRRVKSDARFASTPVVAVTALAMDADRARVGAAGFDGYITKPIDPQHFVGEIESFLAGRF